jgi:hypothetical protein
MNYDSGLQSGVRVIFHGAREEKTTYVKRRDIYIYIYIYIYICMCLCVCIYIYNLYIYK